MKILIQCRYEGGRVVTLTANTHSQGPRGRFINLKQENEGVLRGRCSELDWPRIGNLVMQSSRDAGGVVRGILGQISPGSNVGSGGMLTLP